MLAPAIEEIAAEHPELTVAKVNVDNERALAMKFGIVSIPYVALIQNGEVVASVLGYKTKADLKAALGI
jgi:thioredoxin 1